MRHQKELAAPMKTCFIKPYENLSCDEYKANNGKSKRISLPAILLID